MTGYSANVEAIINTTAGEYVPFGSFGFAYFVIHDGWRIKGLQGDYLVTGNTTVADVHMDAAEFGLNGGNMTNSTFWGTDLGPPVLNISALSLERVTDRGPSAYYENEEFRVIYDASELLWEYDNQTYNLDYLQRSGNCQAVSDYNWGFSYVQLFIMIIFHITWSSGLYIMWLRAYIIMKKRGRGKEDVAGEHKAVFELAAAMREHIGEPAKEEGGDVSAFTEANLRRRVTKDLRGGSISYTNPLLPNGDTGHEWETKALIKSHKLSIMAMVVCILAMALSAAYLPRTTMLLLPLPGVLALALYIGATRKSRVVLFAWIYSIVTIPTQLIIMLYAR
ncbi:hypothetical protein J4E91_006692 [Alternaria rosae]|nr:hypothetical protein J4E91_006692 [Alternaria rosae]